MAVLNFDDAFAGWVLLSGGIDPATHDASTMVIDYIPGAPRATVRVTRTFSVEAGALRTLVKASATDMLPGPVTDALTAMLEAQIDNVKDPKVPKV